MRCPKCGDDSSAVLDTRKTDDTIVRRRRCLRCDHRYRTTENLLGPESKTPQHIAAQLERLAAGVDTIGRRMKHLEAEVMQFNENVTLE